MINLENVIHDALEYLHQQQQSNGSFIAYQSKISDDFTDGLATNSIFVSALIGGALTKVTTASVLRNRIANYLLGQASADWTWNYIDRKAGDSTYPDDLDDTACAMIAILSSDALISGQAKARLLTSFMRCEQQPGGPYRTWLLDGNHPKWRDVDIAVNANIALLYSHMGIVASSLNSYLTHVIRRRQLKSPYYMGIAPLLYFLARSHDGSAQLRLRRLICEQLDLKPGLVQRALLVSAACYAGVAKVQLAPHIVNILSQRVHTHWPAQAFYTDPPVQGEARYAGSATLTTALVVEALGAWSSNAQLTQVAPSVAAQSAWVAYQQRRRDSLRQCQPQIVDAAGVIARAIGYQNTQQVADLNSAHLDGWLAYEIYDNIVDEQLDEPMLGVANIVTRASIGQFCQVVNRPEFSSFVCDTFCTMDKALCDEAWTARNIQKPPRYHRIEDLVQRSWGFCLAPTAIMLLAGYALHSSQVELLQAFIRHYLVAKQLCDDAHDWEDDLANSRVSYVVAGVLRAGKNRPISELRSYYWQTYCIALNKKIRRQLALASRSLKALSAMGVDDKELRAWLEAIEASCLAIDQGRREVLSFITELDDQRLLQ